MRLLQTLPFIGLVAAVTDSHLARRQVDVVRGVFEKVQSDTAAVGTAAKGFSGDPGPLTQASNSLLADLKAGVQSISSAQEVDITGATQIAQYVTGLQSTVQATIKDIIAIKPQAAAAGQGGVIYESLVQQRAASQALAEATTKKTPAALQSVAQQLSAGIISAIDEGIASYKEFEGQSAPSAPAAGSGSSDAGAAAPLASSAPKSGVSTGTSTPPECGPAKTTPKTPVTTPTPSKTATPPAQFTGAAGSTNPYMGFVLAAAGLVATL